MFNIRPGPYFFPINLFSGSPKPKQGTPLVSRKIATNPAFVDEAGSPAAVPATPFPPPPRRKRVGRDRSSRLDAGAARRVRIQRSMQRDHRSAGVLPAKRYDLPKFEELNSTPRNPTTTPPALAREEQIFMEQLAHLNMHRDFRKTLVDARKCTERAREVAPLLSQEREKKVEIAHIRAQEEQRLMAEAEIAAQRQAEEKKKADTLSRIRMRKLKDQLREERKLFALAHETARRRDEARAKANSAQRQAQELKARKERANRATAKLAAMRDAFNREKAARDVRDWTRRVAQDTGAQRQQHAILQAEVERQKQEEKNQLCARFTLYDAKWEALKGPDELPPLYFKQLPWPILADINTADEITLQAMKTFIFHPERLSPIGKSPKERLRLELLKWHPDKFNAKILGRIAQEQQAHVQEVFSTVHTNIYLETWLLPNARVNSGLYRRGDRRDFLCRGFECLIPLEPPSAIGLHP